MTGISTSIQLIDRISAPINNIISALDSVCSTFETVDRAMDKAFDTSTINAARQAIAAAQEQLVQLGNEQDNYTNKVKKSENGLLAMARKLAAAYGIFRGITGSIGMSDQLAQIEARLNLLPDKLQVTEEQLKGVAKRSRASFTDTADVISKLGQRAGDAFNNSGELLQFGENLNKMFIITGASQSEIASASLQLTQALGSGVLRGEEFNAVFESAPNVIGAIAKHLNLPIGKMREMAGEGKISAELVKNALLGATNEINEQYEKMPMTWVQTMTLIKDEILYSFKPVLTKINELANNQGFRLFAQNAVYALSGVAMVLLEIMEITGTVTGFIKDNWEVIAPIVYGVVFALSAYTAALIYHNTVQGISNAITAVSAFRTSVATAKLAMQTGVTFAATAAQHGFNAALLACPLVWIILAIVAVIALVYAAAVAIAKLTGVAQSGFGVIVGGINYIIQFWKNFGLMVANIGIGIGKAIFVVASNIVIAFGNAIKSVKAFFYDLLATGLEMVVGLIKALNKLPFVEIDFSGLSESANKYAEKSAEIKAQKEEYKNVGEAFNSGFNTFDTFQQGWAADAFNAGAKWGDSVAEKVSKTLKPEIPEPPEIGTGYDASKVPENTAITAENTGKTADALKITGEDLKYLNEITEREVVNRFTTAEIKVELGGVTNNVSSNTDLDGTVGYLVGAMQTAMEKAAEGVHD